jgi:6-phosphogluconolactonase
MSERPNTFRYSGKEKEMAGLAAAVVIGTAVDAVRTRGVFTLALSGGTSPQPVYRELAHGITASLFHHDIRGALSQEFSVQNSETGRMPWKNTLMFWSDERCVPPTDNRSNYRMVKESLLTGTGPVEKNIFRMPAETDPADKAADAYEAELRRHFNEKNGNLGDGFPIFDLIMLGMGGDGHTASLFPGDPKTLAETSVWVTAVAPPPYADPPVTRLTLTLPVINHARNVLFFISGTSKAALADKIFSGKEKELPASLVKPEKGNLYWFCDQP